MDIISKFFKKEELKDNKLIDEFYFKKNRGNYKVKLIKDSIFIINYWVQFKEQKGFGDYWVEDSKGFIFLFFAKRYFNKLKGKYCKKL